MQKTIWARTLSSEYVLPKPSGEALLIACPGCMGTVAGVSLPLEQQLSPPSSSHSPEGAVGWME